MAVLAGKFLRAHNVPRCLLTKLLQRSASPTSSFEKTLSTLADRISKTTAHRDALLSSRRRWKVLWTLYTTFAYLLFSVILVLVTGRAYWSYAEYGAVAGGPIVIYLVRLALSYLFDLRVNRAQATLDDLFKQRQTAIDKFKKETQYDSTQKLLEKYGAEKPKTAPKTPGEKPKAPRKQQNGQMPQRTGLPPPPTANIQRPLPPLPPGAVPHPQQIPPMALNPKSAPIHDTTAEFAPNAFPGGSVPPRAPGDGPHIPERQWYDRLMDVLLGDDETKPGSRLALVCANPQCRLVNGQAPPGVKSLSEVGRWRCAECKSWNGTDQKGGDAGVKELLREAGVDVPASPVAAASPVGRGAGHLDDDDEDDADTVNVRREDIVTDQEDISEVSTGLDSPSKGK